MKILLLKIFHGKNDIVLTLVCALFINGCDGGIKRRYHKKIIGGYSMKQCYSKPELEIKKFLDISVLTSSLGSTDPTNEDYLWEGLK